MGQDCSKSITTEEWSTYDIMSPSLTDHYVLGKLMKSDRLAVHKVAQLRPSAVKVLRSWPLSTNLAPEVLRRISVLEKTVLVRTSKIEWQAGNEDRMAELEDQRDALEMNIRKIQALPHGKQPSEELAMLHASLGNLNVQIGRQKRGARGLRDQLLLEKGILEKCRHRFLVKYIECFEDTRQFHTVFEHNCGSIVDWWPNGVLNIDVVARQSYQLVSALHFLHSVHILHRDVRPENLLLQHSHMDSDVLLSNMSSAIQLRPLDYLDNNGTPHFASHEGLVSYSKAFPSDVLDCGATIYWMLLGRCPFIDAGDTSTSSGARSVWSSGRLASLCGHVGKLWSRKRSTRTVAPEERVLSPPEFRGVEELSFTYVDGTECYPASCELLRQMLHKSPTQRITIDQVIRNAWIAMAGPEAERPNVRQSFASVRSSRGLMDYVMPTRVLNWHPQIVDSPGPE